MKKVHLLSDVELLMEKSHMEQIGYAGQVRLAEVKEELQMRWDARRKSEKESQEQTNIQEVDQEVDQEVVINVTFEEGYRWSVDINGGESVNTKMTKVEAMQLARKLRKDYDNAVINEQKLTKQERKENVSWLHEHSYSYDKN